MCVFTCRMWTSSMRTFPRIQWYPTCPRTLCGFCDYISTSFDAFRCRKDCWMTTCSCTACSTLILPRWSEWVCILSRSTCTDHRRRGNFVCARMCSNRIACLCASRDEWGRYLHKLGERVVYTCLLHRVCSPLMARFPVQENLWCHPWWSLPGQEVATIFSLYSYLQDLRLGKHDVAFMSMSLWACWTVEEVRMQLILLNILVMLDLIPVRLFRFVLFAWEEIINLLIHF